MKDWVIFVFLICLILISGCVLQPEFPVKADVEQNRIQPEEKYEIYELGIGRSEVLDWTYIRKSDYGENKTYMLNGSLLKLSNLEIRRNSFYVNGEYRGKSEKTGFWWISEKMDPSYCNASGGCPHFGGDLSIEVDRWEENYSLYIDYVSIRELDINETTSDWNYMKVVLGRYREGPPPEPIITKII